jgi:chemotaxis family two-component system sensor kinase Cph1
LRELISELFDTAGFPRRWDCGHWTAAHGWVHIVADVSIFAAYAAIPAVLGHFAIRRKDVPFLPVFWLFAAFIFFCGVGHLIEDILVGHGRGAHADRPPGSCAARHEQNQ